MGQRDDKALLGTAVFLAAVGLLAFFMGNDAYVLTILLLIVGVGGVYLYMRRS